VPQAVAETCLAKRPTAMKTMFSFFFDLVVWGAIGGMFFLIWG
jgi:hypothetical protein